MRVIALVGAALALAACGQSPSDPSDPSPVTTPPESAATATEEVRPEVSLWTTAQRAPRRTCPSTRCGVVGELYFQEGAAEFERRGDWVRTTKVYDAYCEDGRSKYVDYGDARCVPENGITNGRFAEWVNLRDLSTTRPPDPADTATSAEKFVAQSDDFNLHRRQFVKGAEKAIAEGRCTAKDFEDNGGWTKSVNQRTEPVYFVWCNNEKVYLNVETGALD